MIDTSSPSTFEAVSGCLFSLVDSRKVILLTGELTPEFSVYPTILRYALAYLYAENDYLIITMVYDDHQRQHNGIAGLEFIKARGARFPRSDAMGYRVSDLAYRETFIRNLDIARPTIAFAFRDLDMAAPAVAVDITIWVTSKADGFEPVPDDDNIQLSLLGQATTCYAAQPNLVTSLTEYI